jgi:hypothetical protein
MKPQRVQRSRKKGFKTPPNTKYVGRPSDWANPYQIRYDKADNQWVVFDEREFPMRKVNENKVNKFESKEAAHEFAVDSFGREYFGYKHGDTITDYYFAMAMYDSVQELKGKNLSCWCSEDLPCHADVLLEVANDEELSKVVKQFNERS